MIKNIKAIYLLLPMFLIAAVMMVSCRKDTDGTPQYKASSTMTGTLDSLQGSARTTVTLSGSGLGKMLSIVFTKDSINAPFLATLNTENALVFQVPDEAAGGDQKIKFTNVDGVTLEVDFKVIALPAVNSLSTNEAAAGDQVTIKGNNFNDVTSVQVASTGEEITVVSKTKTQMVVQMPATDAERVAFKMTNASGVSVSQLDVVNVNKALTVYSDQYDNNFQNWGWGGDYNGANTADKISGANSMIAAFDPNGTWGGLQIGNGNLNVSGKKYFSFWIKGADTDKELQVTLNWGAWKRITIPANKWTHFEYTLNTDFSSTNLNKIETVIFQIVDAGKTVLFDNVMFHN